VYKYQTQGLKQTEPGFSQWYPVMGQEAMRQTDIREIPLKHKKKTFFFFAV